MTDERALQMRDVEAEPAFGKPISPPRVIAFFPTSARAAS